MTIRQKIIDKIEDSLRSLTIANGYNFNAGLVDIANNRNNILSDFKASGDIKQYPCCFARLGEDETNSYLDYTEYKVNTSYELTLEAFIGICVSARGKDGALKTEIEKAIEDLQDFILCKKEDATKCLRLYDIPEIKRVVPSKTTPFYDNNSLTGWAIARIKIITKNN